MKTKIYFKLPKKDSRRGYDLWSKKKRFSKKIATISTIEANIILNNLYTNEKHRTRKKNKNNLWKCEFFDNFVISNSWKTTKEKLNTYSTEISILEDNRTRKTK